ncbi:hypothetical protein MTO96_006429 [Rhipicephalus appendiculatus]
MPVLARPEKKHATASKPRRRRASFDRGSRMVFSTTQASKQARATDRCTVAEVGEDAGPDVFVVVDVHLLLSRATTRTQVARSTELPREKRRTRTGNTPHSRVSIQSRTLPLPELPYEP